MNTSLLLEGPSAIRPPQNIDLSKSSKKEQDAAFAYYYNLLYNQVIEKEGIEPFCPIHKGNYLKTLSTTCDLCGTKVVGYDNSQYIFTTESMSIKYHYLRDQNIFVAEISDITNRSSGLASYREKNLTKYVAFHPYLGPLKIEVKKNYEEIIKGYNNNSFVSDLLLEYDKIEKAKNKAIDSIKTSKLIPKRDKSYKLASLENNTSNLINEAKRNLENEYLLKCGLYRLFDWKFPIQLSQSKPDRLGKLYVGGKLDKYFITLEAGNYVFSLNNDDVIYNIRGYGPTEYGITERSTGSGPYGFQYDVLYNTYAKSLENYTKYILAGGYSFKTSKYVKRYKTRNGGFVTVDNENPEPSRNLLNDLVGPPVEAYFVDVIYYQLFVLSKFGHPIFKIPGGYYKNIRDMGDNVFEVTNVTTNKTFKLTLLDSAQTISDIMKVLE